MLFRLREVVSGALCAPHPVPEAYCSTVPKRIETPENRRYAVARRITHYA
jgi:hypothetical protein